jgi:phage RecT family recombinase
MENAVTRQTFAPIEKAMQESGFSIEKVKQEISFAIQQINKSPQLQKCSPESKLQAVLNISNIGLSLNPAAKEAYLIPRWNNAFKCYEAALEPSYIGLVKLLTDSASVVSIVTQLVYEKDAFSLDVADNRNPVQHKPMLIKSQRGQMIGTYALATLPDGSRQVEWMDIEELNHIRDRSETYKAFTEGKIKSCTWETDYGEMCRKTVIKRLYKYLPRTERMHYVDTAVHHDNQDYTASNEQLSYIESLLHTSTLDERQRSQLEMEMSVMSSQRASQVIENLKNNQQTVDHGVFPNEKGLAKHIRKIATA